METTIIKDLFKSTQSYENQEIKLEGWVRTVRDSKTFGFIELNDGSFFNNVQIVFNNNLSNFEEICKLTIGSSIAVTGKLVLTPDAKQPFEIQATSVAIAKEAKIILFNIFFISLFVYSCSELNLYLTILRFSY